MTEAEGRKPNLREKTIRFLDLPAEGLPKAELFGEREVFLQNYREILSYGKQEIHVDGGAWVLRIVGRDLEIKAMRVGELRIFGEIDRLEVL